MKTVGILGGMSWESTALYYKIMNQQINDLLGGMNALEAVIYSINLGRLEKLLKADDWGEIEKILKNLALKTEAAGAEFLIITSNAAHKVAHALEKSLQIPLLHIADPTAEAINGAGIKKVALLGTKVTMSENFYVDRLRAKHGIEAIVPPEKEQKRIHKIIFDELVRGKVRAGSKKVLLEILNELEKTGIEGVILGCTELNLLIEKQDTDLPLFDTMRIHAMAAVNFSLFSLI